MAGTLQYIKIARIDGYGNDLTDTLESLSNVTLPSGSGFETFIIRNRSRFNDYYLYFVMPPDRTDIDNADKADLSYSFSGSYTGTRSSFRGFVPITSSVDNQNFFIPGGTTNSLGSLDNSNFFISSYRIPTLPNKNLGIRISSSLQFLIGDGKTTTSQVTASVRLLSNPLEIGVVPSNPTILAESVLTQSNINLDLADLVFTGSYDLLTTIDRGSFPPGNCIYFDFKVTARDGSTEVAAAFDHATFTNGIFEISSSNAINNQKELVVEPYLTSPFYGTDCDVTYGNASQPVINPFLQDIDYNSGTIVPTNNEAIINNTATKGTVPESFFTVKSILNPTYSSVNSTTRYNTDASSYNAQTSGGTFVAYYKSSVTSGTPGSGYTTNFVLSYLITPDEEALEITNTEEMLNLLSTNFSVDANPLPSSEYPFGLPTGEIKVKATPLSGSDSESALEYRGTSLVKGINFNLPSPFNIVPPITVLQVKTSGSSSPGSNNSFGGIIYPASISLTSHADLPSKAREILTRNNIIAPSSTSS